MRSDEAWRSLTGWGVAQRTEDSGTWLCTSRNVLRHVHPQTYLNMWCSCTQAEEWANKVKGTVTYCGDADKSRLWKAHRTEKSRKAQAVRGKCPSRENLTVRHCCHSERAGVACTAATGIHLQSGALTPSLGRQQTSVWRWQQGRSVCGVRVCTYMDAASQVKCVRQLGLDQNGSW